MIRQIRPRDLARSVANGHAVILLDVRQPWEHELAALPGSWLVPLGELAARAATLDVPPEAAVVVYCHHGVRSLTGAGILQQAGFTNVASLARGIDGWSLEVDPTVPRY